MIQRFGSALNLNVHLSMLFLDGAHQFHGSRVTFHRARRPDNSELTGLLDTLSRRIVRVLKWRGLLVADSGYPTLDFELGWSPDNFCSWPKAVFGISLRLGGFDPNGPRSPTLKL